MNNEFDEIGKASRKSAWITIAGAAIAAVSIIYAYLNLDVIDKTAVEFSEESAALTEELEATKVQYERTRERLTEIQQTFASNAIGKFSESVCENVPTVGSDDSQFIRENEGEIRSLLKVLVDLGLSTEGALQGKTKEYYVVLQEQLNIHLKSDNVCLSYFINNKAIEEMLDRPPYKSCRHPNHGIEGYKFEEVISQNSGWVGGGMNQNWWCNSMMRSYESSRKVPVTWKDTRSSEQVKKDWLGHVEYKYFCTATAQGEPIYKMMSSEYCGN